MSMSLEGTAALAEAVSHAAYILADASRGGAVVEQIPYVPAAEVMDFDKILLGSAACVLAYTWAAYEFGKVMFSTSITAVTSRHVTISDVSACQRLLLYHYGALSTHETHVPTCIISHWYRSLKLVSR